MKEKFEFVNGNIIEFSFENKSNSDEIKTISLNEKEKYSFKGSCGFIPFINKKGEMEGLIFKIRSNFNHIYYLVFNSEKSYIRNSSNVAIDLISNLVKNKKKRINAIENLIV